MHVKPQERCEAQFNSGHISTTFQHAAVHSTIQRAASHDVHEC